MWQRQRASAAEFQNQVSLRSSRSIFPLHVCRTIPSSSITELKSIYELPLRSITYEPTVHSSPLNRKNLSHVCIQQMNNSRNRKRIATPMRRYYHKHGNFTLGSHILDGLGVLLHDYQAPLSSEYRYYIRNWSY